MSIGGWSGSDDNVTLAQFQHFTGMEDKPNQRNLFAHRLNQGDILAGVEIEPGGVDKDDDMLVIHFKHDPSAAPLTIKAADQTGDSA